jgi:hypothetical protein
MQVLSMFRSPCARRFPPKIIIIRIERGEIIKDKMDPSFIYLGKSLIKYIKIYKNKRGPKTDP